MSKNPLQNTKNEEEFSTFDLGLASALVSKGCSLKILGNTRNGKTRFIFHNSLEIEEWAGKYWNNSLKVSARTFFENQKMLKNRIYSE